MRLDSWLYYTFLFLKEDIENLNQSFYDSRGISVTGIKLSCICDVECVKHVARINARHLL